MYRFVTALCLGLLTLAWSQPVPALPAMPVVEAGLHQAFSGWKTATDNPEWQLWYWHGVVTAAYNRSTDDYRRRDLATGTWGLTETPPWGARPNFGIDAQQVKQDAFRRALDDVLKEADKTKMLLDRLAQSMHGKKQQQLVANFGIEADRLADFAHDGEYRLNGRPITRDLARHLVAGGELADDSQKLRFTVIGPEAARKSVLHDLETHVALAPYKGRFMVQAYAPDNWAVKDYGFKCDGSPTLYFQRPDGGVLFRWDSYAGPDQLAAAFARTADPNYDPNKDKSGKGGPIAIPGVDPALVSKYGPAAVIAAITALLLWLSRTKNGQTAQTSSEQQIVREAKAPAFREHVPAPPDGGSVLLPPPLTQTAPPPTVKSPPTLEAIYDQFQARLAADETARLAEEARKAKEARVAAFAAHLKSLAPPAE